MSKSSSVHALRVVSGSPATAGSAVLVGGATDAASTDVGLGSLDTTDAADMSVFLVASCASGCRGCCCLATESVSGLAEPRTDALVSLPAVLLNVLDVMVAGMAFSCALVWWATGPTQHDATRTLSRSMDEGVSISMVVFIYGSLMGACRAGQAGLVRNNNTRLLTIVVGARLWLDSYGGYTWLPIGDIGCYVYYCCFVMSQLLLVLRPGALDLEEELPSCSIGNQAPDKNCIIEYT